MIFKLQFDITEVFKDFLKISTVLKEDIEKIAEKASKKYKRLSKWRDNLEHFITKHENIQLNLIPSLENSLAIKFIEPNLITLTLFRPSTRNIFIELGKYFQEEHFDMFKLEKFEFMSELGDIADGLALLGDSALNLAATQEIWEDGILDKGKITIEKAKIVGNLNLARYCDELDLYNNRIHLESKKMQTKIEKIQHIKGTLVEGIIGVIYIENGIDGILKILKMLKVKYFNEG
jgi:dsRNA-specific ribonuclease